METGHISRKARHFVSFALLLLLLCIGSGANALPIRIDVQNTSQNGDTISSLYLGFNDMNSPDLFFMPNIDLLPGDTFSTDITNTNIFYPGASLLFSYLIGQAHTIYEEFTPPSVISITPGDVINIGNPGGFVSATLSLSTVVPEPASLILLSSGITGLWLVRKKKM